MYLVYGDPEHAAAARKAMDNRFFGGKSIRASLKSSVVIDF